MIARAFCFSAPVPYREAAQWQDQLARARASDRIPDVVLFLEHMPVVTLGVRARGRSDHLKLPLEEYARRGIEVCESSRGGDVTWHGPGQLVMYPILLLGRGDVRGFLYNLEEVGLRTAREFGVRAERRTGLNGVWTPLGKLAAIGFRIRKGVTLHGMSFNVCPDLSGFETIVPCGLREPVTSLRELLGPCCPSVAETRERMAKHFEAVFQRPLCACESESAFKHFLEEIAAA